MARSEMVSKTILSFLFSIVLFDIMGANLLITVQAFIVREYNTTALAVSLLVVIYAACMFIAAPILGRISDRYGRRPILLICLLGSAVGYFIFGIGGALWVLYVSRAIDGFTGGNFAIVQAYIADVSSEDERAKYLGLLGAAAGLGFIIGPVFGGLLSQISLTTPVYIAGIFALVASILCIILLPESLSSKNKNHTAIKLKDINPFKSIGGMLTRPVIGTLLIISAIVELVFDGGTVNIPVYLIYKFNISPLELGLIMASIGIILVIIQGGLIGKLSEKFSDKTLILMGLLIMATGFALFTLATSLWLIYALGAIIAIGLGIFLPVLSAQLSKNVSASEQGTVFGVSSSLLALMAAIGPLWAGFAYDAVMPSAPYWIAVILLVFAFVLMVRLKIIMAPSTDTNIENS